MKMIQTDKTVAAIGPYSQAVEDGGVVYLSGQIPVDPKTGEVKTDIKEATRQCLTNVKNLLEAAGSDLNHVMKVNLFILDMDQFSAINEVYGEFLRNTSRPAAASPSPPFRKMWSSKRKPLRA